MNASDRSGAGLGLDLSGLRLSLEGLRTDLADRLAEDWAAFVTARSDDSFLRVSVEHDEEGDEPGEGYAPKEMRSTLSAGRARYWMPEGSVEVDNAGTARIRLAGKDAGRAYYTLINMLRASLAWCMPGRGGAFLHAAGLVVDDRAYVLVGAEGSGKSTWARLGEGAGSYVISDDVVLVDGIGSDLEVLGTPFRSTHVSTLVPGRWPLAAILFPRHGGLAALSRIDPLPARSRLLANLPFVAEGIERDIRIEQVLNRFSTAAACRELTFGLDDSFVELLRRWSSEDPPSGSDRS